MDTLRFKNDGPRRKRLFVAGAMVHPAKGHIALWEEMVLRYSQPGDTVLDPMAGIGTSLVAALMGRNVICVELEGHFVDPMRRSWEKMRNIPMLGYEVGSVVILRGDARCLPLPDASVGAAITSPPYEGIVVSAGDQARSPSIIFPDGEPTYRSKINRDGLFRLGYTRKPVDTIVTSPPYEEQNIRDVGEEPYGSKRYGGMARQIKNTNRYTRKPVDAIVTSPPYAETGLEDKTTVERRTERIKIALARGEVITPRMQRYIDSQRWSGNLNEQQGYTRKPVDAIVTSPPYQITETSSCDTSGPATAQAGGDHRTGRKGTKWEYTNQVTRTYGGSENIGNLRSTAYWDAMRQVYAECWRVLKPDGILALVLKGFTRTERRKTAPQDAEKNSWRHDIAVLRYCQCNHLEEEHLPGCQHTGCDCPQFRLAREEVHDEGWVRGGYVDLPGQTEALLLEAGWQKYDHWRRELWSLSFWRTLQKQNHPETWDDRLMYEEVRVFKKPGVGGEGVDSVITSPPYEGSLQRDAPELQARVDRIARAQPPGEHNGFQRAIDNPGNISTRSFGYGYSREKKK